MYVRYKNTICTAFKTKTHSNKGLEEYELTCIFTGYKWYNKTMVDFTIGIDDEKYRELILKHQKVKALESISNKLDNLGYQIKHKDSLRVYSYK